VYCLICERIKLWEKEREQTHIFREENSSSKYIFFLDVWFRFHDEKRFVKFSQKKNFFIFTLSETPHSVINEQVTRTKVKNKSSQWIFIIFFHWRSLQVFNTFQLELYNSWYEIKSRKFAQIIQGNSSDFSFADIKTCVFDLYKYLINLCRT
jgi:hypothetical protein